MTYRDERRDREMRAARIRAAEEDVLDAREARTGMAHEYLTILCVELLRDVQARLECLENNPNR